MVVRRTMTEMLRELRGEIGMSLDTSVQANVVDKHKLLLQRAERMLYDSEEWPHLMTSFEKTSNALVFQVALPAGLDPGGITSVSVKATSSATRPVPLQHGLSDAEVFSVNPAEAKWPPRFWRLQASNDPAEDDYQRTVVVWPVPDRNYTLTFYGRRALGSFVNGADQSTVDSDVIVLQAAAEILNGQQDPNATVKASAARQRIADILARERGDVSAATSMLPGLNPRRRKF